MLCLLLQGWAIAGMVHCGSGPGAGSGNVAAAAAASTIDGSSGELAAAHEHCETQDRGDSRSPEHCPEHLHQRCAACFATSIASLMPMTSVLVEMAAIELPGFDLPPQHAPAPSRLERPPRSSNT